MTSILKNRLLPLLLCAAMVFGMLPVPVLAQEEQAVPVIEETTEAIETEATEETEPTEETESALFSTGTGTGEATKYIRLDENNTVYFNSPEITSKSVAYGDESWKDTKLAMLVDPATAITLDFSIEAKTSAPLPIVMELGTFTETDVAMYTIENGVVEEFTDFSLSAGQFGGTNVSFDIFAGDFTLVLGKANPKAYYDPALFNIVCAEGDNLDSIQVALPDSSYDDMVTDLLDSVYYTLYTVTLDGYTGGDVEMVMDLNFLNLSDYTADYIFDANRLGAYILTEEDGAEFFAPLSDFIVTESDEGPCFCFIAPGESFTVAVGVLRDILLDAELVGLDVGFPDKDLYFLGQDLTEEGDVYIDLTGLEVSARYALDGQEFTRELVWNQHNEEIDGYAILADDMTTVGKKTITVSYGGFTGGFNVWVCLEDIIDEETGVSIRFDAENVLSVDVDRIQPGWTVSKIAEQLFDGAYVVYDITAQYIFGNSALTGTAMVTLPIPEGVEYPAVYYISDSGRIVTNMNAIVNDDHTVTFAAKHFSQYAIGKTTGRDGLQQQIHYVESTSRNVWTLVEGDLAAGNKYLIVNSSSQGTCYALSNNNGNVDDVQVVVNNDENGTYIEKNYGTEIEWTASHLSNNTFWDLENNGEYLGHNNNNGLTLDNTSENWSYSDSQLWYTYRFITTRYRYLSFSNNNWGLSSNSTNVYFFEEGQIVSPGYTYSVEGSATVTQKVLPNETATISHVVYFDPDDGDPVPAEGEWTTTYRILDDPMGVISAEGITGNVVHLSGKSSNPKQPTILVAKSVGEVNGEPVTIWDQFLLEVEAAEYQVEITGNYTKVPVGTSVQLGAAVTARNTTIANAVISWSATMGDGAGGQVEVPITSDGVLSCNAPGTIRVVATYIDPDGKPCQDKVTVTAELAENYIFYVEDPASNTLKEGMSLQLNPVVTADGVTITDPVVVWEVDNESIATVSEDGVVLGQNEGTVTVTATYTAPNGQVMTDSKQIHVEGVRWDLKLHEVISMETDENGNITRVDYEPERITQTIIKKNVGAGDVDHSIWAVIKADGENVGILTPEQLTKLSFVSSDEDVATVDSKTGKVTFKGVSGTVTITAMYEYAKGKYATDSVTYSVSNDSYFIPSDGTDDFPEYPNEGSIRFDKTATAVGNFNDTGIAKVELSMTGVPFTKDNEIDVVIMVDLSSSMDENNRIGNAKDAVQAALDILVKKQGTDGEYNGNRVAIYGFNGWYSSANSYKNYVESIYEYYPSEDKYSGNKDVSKTITRLAPMQNYDDAKFTAAFNAIENADTGAGTNYAAALRQCYYTLQQTRDPNREQYVIFLTDGAASTGFAYVDGTGYSVYTTSQLGTDGYGTNGTRNIINTVAQKTEYYSQKMKEEGVEIYTVGLQIKGTGTGNTQTQQTQHSNTILKKIAGTNAGNATATGFEEYAMTIGANDDPNKVVSAFKEISQKILDAAKDVKVEDQITDEYTMVFDAPNAVIDGEDGGQEYYIEVLDYALNPVKDSDGTILDYVRGDSKSLVKLYLGTASDGSYYAATKNNSTNGNNKFATPTFDTNPVGTKRYWTTEQDKGDCGVQVEDAAGNVYYFVSDGNGTHTLRSGAFAYGTSTPDYIDGDETNTDPANVTTTCQNLIIATPYFVYNAATKMLVWTTEALSSNELTMSYFLYLDESAGYEEEDDQVRPGTYNTNKYATLSYENHNQNPCKQDFPIPKFTWSGAQVNYVFYLVNDKGQPVNRAGRVVPFSEAIYVTEVFTENYIWQDLQHSESMEAERLAKKLVDPNVFKLFDPTATYTIHVFEDENKSNHHNHFNIGGTNAINTTYVFNTKADKTKYSEPAMYSNSNTFWCKSYDVQCVNDDITTARYTGTEKQVSYNTIKNTENATPVGGYPYFRDDKGEVYTIVLKEDAKKVASGFDYNNTTVAFAVQWLGELKSDTVVIDYGLDVLIDVSMNDALTTGLVGVRVDQPTLDGEGSFVPERNNSVDLILDSKKVATANLENQLVRVSLDKNNGMQLKRPMTFYYEAMATLYQDGNLREEPKFASVTVIPATTVYYEDEYVSLKTYKKVNGLLWDSGTVGWTQNSTPAKLPQATDRPGADKIGNGYDADNAYGYDGVYTEFSTYSFENSAMAVLDKNTQAIAEFSFYGTRCDIIGLTSNKTGSVLIKVFEGGTTSGRLVRSHFVDTYFGYKFENDQWIQTDSADPDAIYQVPVMTVENLTYGLYTVQVGATYSAYDEAAAYSESMEFYLDAIRIYNPTGNLNSDAYQSDNEAMPAYVELRNHLIAASEYQVSENANGEIIVSGNPLNGVVFIDGKGNTSEVADYVRYGPNNEVYLANGESVAFNLNIPQGAVDVQLGLKLANGDSANYSIHNVDSEGKPINAIEGTMKTATDLYYSIWGQRSQTIVIENTGGGILSITNFKITYGEEDTDTDQAELFWMDADSVRSVLMSMRSMTTPVLPQPPVTEPTEPEVTEPTKPTETEPVETEPTKPSETEPVETEPTKPTATEPVETEPTEPTETEPVETDPTEPSVTEPVETEPTEPTGTEPVETEPTEPTETEPVETEPTEPSETEPTEEPFDPDSVELPFGDVAEEDWFRDSVAYVYSKGLMNGVSQDDFAPQATATRAMIVTVLYRIEGQPATAGTTKFQDVPNDTWYSDAVSWASSHGIVNGLSETEFGPDRDVTREQLATMLCRYLTAKGLDTAGDASLSAFPDAANVSVWAAEAMRWAIANGIITGSSDGTTVTLQPGANALRSQIAAILQRFCEKY